MGAIKPAKETVFVEIGGVENTHRPSHIHLDIRVLPGIDIGSDAEHLPLASAVVDEIYGVRALEKSRAFNEALSFNVHRGKRFGCYMNCT